MTLKHALLVIHFLLVATWVTGAVLFLTRYSDPLDYAVGGGCVVMAMREASQMLATLLGD